MHQTTHREMSGVGKEDVALDVRGDKEEKGALLAEEKAGRDEEACRRMKQKDLPTEDAEAKLLMGEWTESESDGW